MLPLLHVPPGPLEFFSIFHQSMLLILRGFSFLVFQKAVKTGFLLRLASGWVHLRHFPRGGHCFFPSMILCPRCVEVAWLLLIISNASSSPELLPPTSRRRWSCFFRVIPSGLGAVVWLAFFVVVAGQDEALPPYLPASVFISPPIFSGGHARRVWLFFFLFLSWTLGSFFSGTFLFRGRAQSGSLIR